MRAAVDRLGLQIPSRDIAQDRRYRSELAAARGRTTVPVLRVVGPDGDAWMPESADIIRWLESRYG